MSKRFFVWLLSAFAFAILGIACNTGAPAASQDPAPEQVSIAAQPYSVNTTVDYSGASYTCGLCGGGGTDYVCPGWGAPWQNGIRNFVDPTPANAPVTSVTVTTYGLGMSGGTISLLLNGTLLGSYVASNTPFTCGGCESQSVTYVNATGIPGYVKGGTNAIQISPTGNPCFDRVELTFNGPSISGIAPNSGPAVGGTAITITGTDFPASTPTVTIGGVAATSVVRVSATSITATTGARAASAGNTVVVAFPSAATITFPNAYTYNSTVSTTSISSNVNPAVHGQSITFSATVPTQNGVVPTGTVTFRYGVNVLGTGALNGAGTAIASGGFVPGAYAMTATYNGDTFYATSVSSTLTQNVNQGSTTTALASSANPSVINGNVTFTATVAAVAPATGTPTGTVTFFDGATNIGTGALSSGIATLTTNALSIATHNVTAVYGATTNFAGSTSSAVVQVVNRDGTSGALTSSANPSTFGGNVTFTATIATGATGGVPTGSVTFADGTTTLGTGVLNGSGVATFTTNALTGGTHTITATYAGDANHNGTSATLSQVVNTAASTTALASSVNPTVFGQSTTLTATVTSLITGTIGGTVTFRDGANTIGTSTIGNGGIATLATSALAIGAHSLTAVYGGSTNYATSTSAAVNQTVNQAATTTVVASSSNPSNVGQSVTFTATINVTAPGAGTASGTVTFRDGSTTLGTGTVNAGAATFSTSSLTTGAHSITAVYAGDTNFTTSTSAAITQTVNAFGATANLTSTPNPSTTGQNVNFTATISGGDAGVPTGNVWLGASIVDAGPEAGSIDAGSVALNDAGVATFATNSLPVGSNTVTATYGGDTRFGTATASVTQVVNKESSTTVITSSANPAAAGVNVTFTATITSALAGATGTVTFLDGATTLGTGTLNGSGVATFATSALAVGAHTMTAVYAGDATHAASTSTALVQNITGATGADGGVTDGGTTTDSGSVVDSGSATDSGTKSDGGTAGNKDGGTSGATDGGTSSTPGADSSGCGCRTAPTSGNSLFLVALGGLALLVARARSRRRSQSSSR